MLMGLKENLLATNPDDFRPFEKCIYLSMALLETGTFAFPIEYQHNEYGDYIQLRLHEKGRINQPECIELSFERDRVVVISFELPLSKRTLEMFALAWVRKSLSKTTCPTYHQRVIRYMTINLLRYLIWETTSLKLYNYRE